MGVSFIGIFQSTMNLIQLYKQDQADRKNPKLLADFAQITKRDAERRKLVAEILSKKKILTKEEHYAVAMIYQHGQGVTHSRLAVRHAKEAYLLGYKPAAWLYAAATDRLLSKQGKPQKYGTQFIKKNEKSKWQLHSVDPKITDEERALYNVPPLRDAKKKVIELNKK